MRLPTPILGLLALLTAALNPGYAAEPPAAGTGYLHMDPPALERTLFSTPTHTMTISGPCPEGSQVILKIISPTRDFKLNRLGKGLGFVWLAVGHAEVKAIPPMYAVLSSGSISRDLSAGEQDATGLAPDFKDVYAQCRSTFGGDLPPGEAARLHREYVSGLIKIFKDAGLYQRREGAVHVSGGRFTAQFVNPAGAPLGEYKVFCYAVRDGKAQCVFQDKFLVTSGGVAQWLALNADKNAGAYGILAAVAAVMAGLLVGVVFGKGARH